jgi:hypothetical protein
MPRDFVHKLPDFADLIRIVAEERASIPPWSKKTIGSCAASTGFSSSATRSN